LDIRTLASKVVTARRLGARKNTASALGLGTNAVSIVSVKTASIADLFNIYFVSTFLNTLKLNLLYYTIKRQTTRKR
jgi:hypothetical protein